MSRHMSRATCLFFLIAAAPWLSAAPTATVRQDAQNRPIPGMVVLDTDGFSTQMLTRIIIFRAFDGTTTVPLAMTKLNQSMKWIAPLAGGLTYHITVTVQGALLAQTWDATPPDILTLYYPDAEIVAMLDDGRDQAAERILCAKRYNREIKANIVRAQFMLDRLKDSALIILP